MVIIKYLVLVFAVYGIVFCNSQKYTGRNWVTYNSPDKSFSINMPQGYKTGTKTTDDEILGTRTENYIYWRFPSSWIRDFDMKTIDFNYFELPEKYKKESEDRILQKYADNFIQDWSKYGTALIQDIQNNGYHWKKFTFKPGDDDPNTSVYYWKSIIKGKVYSLTVWVYNNYDNQQEINRAFNSFRVLP